MEAIAMAPVGERRPLARLAAGNLQETLDVRFVCEPLAHAILEELNRRSPCECPELCDALAESLEAQLVAGGGASVVASP